MTLRKWLKGALRIWICMNAKEIMNKKRNKSHKHANHISHPPNNIRIIHILGIYIYSKCELHKIAKRTALRDQQSQMGPYLISYIRQFFYKQKKGTSVATRGRRRRFACIFTAPISCILSFVETLYYIQKHIKVS